MRAPEKARAPICDVPAIDERLIRKVARRSLDAGQAEQLSVTFKMLANPTRVRIVDALSRSEMCVCDLTVLLDMRVSAVSHQLALLKLHRIVRNRREGKMVYYALDDEHVRVLFDQASAHLKHRKAP